ncbi:MAG: flagellar biosynthesis protein FlhB [Oscillospiraceae bacterium]|nr:flagellar biosynthesis protein FlhB [Oscillospiraceae bacterium]
MPAGEGGGEKTEKATPKKRKDAREKEGNVLQSKEVGIAVSVFGIFIVMLFIGHYMLRMLTNVISNWVGKAGSVGEMTSEFVTSNAVEIITYIVLIVGPLLLCAMFFGILPGVIQTKGLFTMKPLKPKFSRLSPINGFKKLFSAQSFVGVIKGIIQIAIILVIVYLRIPQMLTEMKKLPEMELIQGIVYTATEIFWLVMTIVIMLAVVAALDFVFQWWQFEKKLKMSKQEVKDEYKQIEGDPHIKSKIKQKQREIAQNRMLQEVPDSDVVVRNPTHYAVALKYEPQKLMAAPMVVAKGQDHLARKIIEIATEHNIKIVEDRPTAKFLYDKVEPGSSIPAELFHIIAEIYADILELKNK